VAQRFSAEIWADWAQTRIFDYLADFRNLPDWHPAVEESELLTMDPYVRNARHLVRGRIAGRRIEAEIVTTELERPRLLVATAANAAAQTTDRFDLGRAEDEKVSVTYRTELQLNAPLRVIGPLMVPALTSAWGAAAAGLERVLNGDGSGLD
jgi:hypothetical protein